MESTKVSHGITVLNKAIKEVEDGISLAPGVSSFLGIGNRGLMDVVTARSGSDHVSNDDAGNFSGLTSPDNEDPGSKGNRSS